MTDMRKAGAWWTRSIGRQLALSHLVVIAVILFVIGFSLLSLARNYFLTALEESLLFQADLITSSLIPGSSAAASPSQPQAAFNTVQSQQLSNLSVQVENLPPIGAGPEGPSEAALVLPNLKETAIQLTSVVESSIALFSPTGEAVLTSGELPLTAGDLDAFLQASLQGQVRSGLIAGNRFAVSTPILAGDTPIGVLLLSHPLGDVESVLNDLLLRFLMAAAPATLLAGVTGFYMARRLQRPISSLTQAAEALGAGDRDPPLPTRRRDELGELGRAFERMRDDLHQFEVTRSRFLSDVSHELRTPLTGIKGLVETLQDGAMDDPRVRDRFLAAIEVETDRLIRLANDLLTLNRLDSHALQPVQTSFSLKSMVEPLCDTFGVEAEKRKVALEVRLPEQPIQLLLDRERLEQVLVNLLDNALKHAPDGSVVRLDAEPVHLPQADSDTQSTRTADRLRGALRDGAGTSLSGDPWLLIHISDQGEGIPREALPMVFERFFRTDEARARDRGGSGLGLSIAKASIELQGGRIWVESPRPDWSGEGNPGTRATVACPLRLAP